MPQPVLIELNSLDFPPNIINILSQLIVLPNLVPELPLDLINIIPVLMNNFILHLLLYLNNLLTFLQFLSQVLNLCIHSIKCILIAYKGLFTKITTTS